MSRPTLTAELVLDQPTIVLGEPTFMAFRVHNPGDVAVWRGVGGDYRNALGRHQSYACAAEDDAGAQAPVPEVAFSGGGILSVEQIAANGSHDHRLFVPNWADFTAAGTYTLTCETAVPISATRNSEPEPVRLSASAVLRVLPADPAALGRVIADLVEQATAGDSGSEALRKLGRIDDARVVPFFAACVRERRFMQPAIRALARFDDDAALAGLVAALSTTAADVTHATNPEVAAQVAANDRIAAAQSLAASPHPEARATLLGLSDDPDHNVRLTVVHALGSDPSADATTRLQAFEQDPAEIVAGEARRYLSQR